jgi:aminoglycoside 3-N-acetyltransferase I
MNTQIEKLSSNHLNEFCDLINIFENVFEMKDFTMPAKEHLQLLLKKPDFMVFVAKENDQVVGGLTVYILDSYYRAKPSAYIYDVGILPEYQRKGVGKQLMVYLTQYCKEKGFEDAYVEAEADDKMALSFYRNTAFSSELHATHFTYSF